VKKIINHQKKLLQCKKCPKMIGPPIVGEPVKSKILLIGQAPGIKEGDLKRPFAWTAGKNMFKWFDSIGLSERKFRNNVYMSAVCRCYPGKNIKGTGDRVPSESEIKKCSKWLDDEISFLKPKLIIPVGKLAISQFINFNKLNDVVGKKIIYKKNSNEIEIVSLPHPSGLSTWYKKDPGKTLLIEALKIIKKNENWKLILNK
jgi:uracil-DNA glycosylase|tara:strand:+ start:1910 stop:2515 length:606 start_codon:yes stop_codon:yes gene_type:complete